MNLAWSLPARSSFDQLSNREQEAVTAAVRRFEDEKDVPTLRRMPEPNVSKGKHELYSFRIDTTLSGIVQKKDDVYLLLDIIRKVQTDALNKLRFN
jgi:hypothetical protein